MNRQAARLHLNLQLLKIIPRQVTNSDAMTNHLALIAELFPRLLHLEIEAALPEDRSPDAFVSNFLSHITTIDIFHDISPQDVRSSTISRSARDMNRLLRHCSKSTRLNAGKVKYTRFPPPSSLSQQLLNHSGTYSWRCRQLRTWI